jgi:hypothetical protein
MLTVRIQNEFGPLRTAIVHDGNNAIDITSDDHRRRASAEELARHPEAGPSSRVRLYE